MTVERTADLSGILGFVVGRIEEQAMRSGERLSEDEHFLLNNLPEHSEVPEFDIGDSEPPIRLFRGIASMRGSALSPRPPIAVT